MGPLLLLLTTFIWGTAFLAQKIGGDVLGPFAVTALRNVLGGAFLLCLIARRSSRAASPLSPRRPAIRAGVLCGVPLFAAMLAQQIGIQYTTPGVSAFLTTNYVLFVPLIAALLTRRWPTMTIVIGALTALVGTYLICLPPSADGHLTLFSIGRGEAWTIFCAFLFAVQMIVVDRYAKDCDILVMSATQLLACAALGLPFLALPSEASRLAALFAAFGDAAFFKGLGSLLYLGILSSGVAYTLQNYGQAKTPAGIAAILLSLESVFGALSGYVVLGDVMAPSQFAGCALVFAAVVGTHLANIFWRTRRPNPLEDKREI